MKIPMKWVGGIDIDLDNVPKKAWVIFAWALFILAVGIACAFARFGGVFIKKEMHKPPVAAIEATALYSK